MNTPINTQLARLPPIITFFTSNILAGDSFPLSIGVFVNGRSHEIYVKPLKHWNLSEYQPELFNNKPLDFYFKNGIEVTEIKNIISKLLGP